jgi:hypothetical protein
MTVATRVLAGDRAGLVQGLMRRYPELGDALHANRATLVVFEPQKGDGALLARAQAALDVIESTLDDDVGWPIFVCSCTARELAPFLGVEPTEAEAVCPGRGVFAAWIAVGEGGVLALDPRGKRLGWDGARSSLLRLLDLAH